MPLTKNIFNSCWFLSLTPAVNYSFKLRHHPNLQSSIPQRFTMSAPASKLPAEEDKTRNPHGDFKAVEASREAFNETTKFHFTQTIDPAWSLGNGANKTQTSGEDVADHVLIDPYAEGRPSVFNYKLLISAIIPRPIAFVSTVSPSPPSDDIGSSTGSGESTMNLAPFSYFSLINHDPPLFTIGFVRGLDAPKDTLRNLVETKECVISIISEGFVEAANSTSINAPYGASEWAVSGLTPAYDCVDVKPPRVKEAVFSVEGKLNFVKEFEGRTVGAKTGTLVVIEGTKFWVRGDAVNEERNLIDPAVCPHRFLFESHAVAGVLKLCVLNPRADILADSEADESAGRHHVWTFDRRD
jgi:flavin reductase (DIM6/NTAB) family NADH-FMN oxidoreductase RutF